MESEQYALMRRLEGEHWWYRSLRHAVRRELPKSGRVLDVGCGSGGMLAEIDGPLGFGIDLSPVALELARGRGLPRLLRGDCARLPFADGAFDAVLLLDVIYHAAVSDDAGVLRECARVLRPGGVLILHAPAFDSLAGDHDRAVHGARRYTAERITGMVRGAGLEIVRAGYRNLAALPFAYAQRRWRRRKPGESDLGRVPWLVNGLLTAWGKVEAAWCSVRPLPIGLSVWCVARRPAGGLA